MTCPIHQTSTTKTDFLQVTATTVPDSFTTVSGGTDNSFIFWPSGCTCNQIVSLVGVDIKSLIKDIKELLYSKIWVIDEAEKVSSILKRLEEIENGL